MEVTYERRIGRLLREYVPEGERGSTQQLTRMVLNVYLQNYGAKRPTKPKLPSVPACFEAAEAFAKQLNPDAEFEYDPRVVELVASTLSVDAVASYAQWRRPVPAGSQ